MVKKIKLWKVIVLSIITLGVYNFVWFAKRRHEIMQHYKHPIPHWLWLVLPGIIALILLIPATVISIILASENEIIHIAIFGYIILSFLVVFGISVWWVWRLAQASEKITNGRVPAKWTIAYWILLGAGAIYMLQFYFNRIPKDANAKTQPKTKPTKRFMAISLTLFAISIALGGVGFVVDPPGNEWNSLENETSELDRKEERVERLYNRYDYCVAQLEKDFPGDLTEENLAAYNKGSRACDRIYTKYEVANKAYMRAWESW